MRDDGVKPSTALIVLLAGACIALYVSGRLEARGIDRDRAELAQLKAERLVEIVDSAGWSVRLVEATRDLERKLQAEESRGALLEAEKAALAREVETLGGELRALADMYADLSGQIETHDAVVHASDSSASVPDSVTAQVDDGLLSGRIAFVPPSTLDLEYRARLALVLGWVEAPDGRALITAKAEHPSVTLSFGEVFYQPPAPVAYCSLGQRAKTAGWSIGLWEAGKLAARIFRSP